jgi:HAD superfamily hydrolase (TIGR01490 family)
LEKLAIFDVDYTLTKKETLLEFYKFMMKKDPRLIRFAPRVLVSTFFYVFKVFDAKRAKENFIAFIDGMKEEELLKLVEEFYEKSLSRIFYTDAIDTMKKLKAKGYKIYLISASAQFYLDELYNIKEVDKVIGTIFKCESGKYSRKIQGENCKGESKVKRLLTVIKEENLEVNFKDSFMFSDSLSDTPLFELVGHPYLINYKKKHDKYEILNWK